MATAPPPVERASAAKMKLTGTFIGASKADNVFNHENEYTVCPGTFFVKDALRYHKIFLHRFDPARFPDYATNMAAVIQANYQHPEAQSVHEIVPTKDRHKVPLSKGLGQ